MTFLYVAIGIVGITLLIFITGLLLPAERVVARERHYNISLEVLYGIVTDNNDWKYRRSLKNLG